MTDQPNLPRMILLHEERADGDVVATEYSDVAASGTPDPYVRRRIAPSGEAMASEIITEFAAAPVRPVSYPAGLPFLPERDVFTTESPTARSPNGARWLCTDAKALLDTVVSMSIDDGWEAIPTPADNELLGTPDVVLERGALWRELTIVPLGEQAMLQLWDVPESIFRAKPT